MIQYRDIEIKRENRFLVTNGLKVIVNNELKVLVKERVNEEYIAVFRYIIDYILTSSPTIVSGQTIGYHSWIFKFTQDDEGSYVLSEADSLGEGYIEGVDYALKIVSEQENECKKFGVSCVFPTFNQNIVISKGVYEGLAIDAVRYPSPPHMAGWWLTTDLYDDKIDSLMNVHYFHVAFKRPDILKYLALPFGFRFLINNSVGDVWFDKKALD